MAAPYLNPGDCVVLFDGVCKLCNGWARFVIRFDRQHRVKLAAVQSPEGQALLAWAGLPMDQFDTMAVIDDAGIHLRSEGFVRVIRRLPKPWPLLGVLRVVPRGVRDWCYDRIARNRYRLFGRYEACLLPNADHEGRFVREGDA
nr:thiol-disulfide oxidoreductase DCC family protein [Pseudomonas sp. PIA16]